jgi:hypothetical protein
MESRSTNLENQKQKVLDFINTRGPSLPVKIASVLRIDSLIVSAFLAELTSDKELFMSSMRVGNSPIYYLRGQEFQLTNFAQYLGSKEREAFELLKDHKVLKDQDLLPPIRVALRSIKDFAFPFEYKDKLYWRFVKFPSNQALEYLENNNYKPVEEKTEGVKDNVFEKKEIEVKPVEVVKEKKEIEVKSSEVIEEKKELEKVKPVEEKEHLPIFQRIKQAVLPSSEQKNLIEKGIQTDIVEKPLKTQGVEIEKRRTEFVQPKQTILGQESEKPLLKLKSSLGNKLKEKSDFVLEVMDFLEKKELVISSEFEWKKKEYFAEVKGDTILGKVNYFVIAKDKKSLTENDLIQALQICHEKKKPVIFIGRGEPNKKSAERLEEIGNLVFYQKLDE